MRRAVLGLAAVLAGALSVPGHAAPDAGARLVAYADVDYVGSDGVPYSVSFGANQTGSTAQLSGNVQSCTGKRYSCDWDFFQIPLKAGEFTFAADGSAAHLHTAIGTVVVDVTWVGAAGQPSPGLNINQDGLNVMTENHAATAQVRLGSLTCNDDRADIALGYGVTGVPTSVSFPPGAPPPAPATVPAGASCR